MAGIVGYGCTGILAIGDDALPMNCPAWDVADLTPLWAEVSVRGEDRRIPGVPGVIPYRRRIDVTEHALTMVIIGTADRSGVEQTNAWVGLENNIAELWTKIINPLDTGNGLQIARLTMPSGALRYANIHILGLRLSEVQGDGTDFAYVVGALQISIPTGRFA